MKKNYNFFTKLIYNKYSWNYLYDNFEEKKSSILIMIQKFILINFLKILKTKTVKRKFLT